MAFWGGHPSSFYDDYEHFYIDNILPEVRDSLVAIETNFIDTSPSNGVLSYDPYTKRSGHSP